MRTAEGLGVKKIYFTGYTSYPLSNTDDRMPHEANRVNRKIIKTSLGAEKYLNWTHEADINKCIADLIKLKYKIWALEQSNNSLKLPNFSPPSKIAIIVGNEVEGLNNEIQDLCDGSLEIPMFGKKESYNVAQATAIALYHLRFAIINKHNE